MIININIYKTMRARKLQIRVTRVTRLLEFIYNVDLLRFKNVKFEYPYKLYTYSWLLEKHRLLENQLLTIWKSVSSWSSNRVGTFPTTFFTHFHFLLTRFVTLRPLNLQIFKSINHQINYI